MNKKILLLVVAILGVASFFYFDLGQYLSLESLKENKEKLNAFYNDNATAMILGFIGVYVAATSFSLPGATILTIAGGAIFGPWVGALAANVGATIGATLAFLAARFLLRDWVEQRFADRLNPFNEGFSNNAVNYILFLRLVPLFPFFLVNLVSGLTHVPLRIYFFGTMFGTLPGTFVYTNAGSNLASIESLSDIASPGVIGAFVLLGVFALIPAIYNRYKSKKTAVKVEA